MLQNLNQLGYILLKQGYQSFPYYEVQYNRSSISTAQNKFITKMWIQGFIYSALENRIKMQKLIPMLKL